MEFPKKPFLYQPGVKPMNVTFAADNQHEITFPNQALANLMPSPMVVASVSPEDLSIMNVSIIVYIPKDAVLKGIIPGIGIPNTSRADVQDDGTSFYSDMDEKFLLSHLYGLNPSGYDQLQFFVTASYDNTIQSNSFTGYQFDFQVDEKSLPASKTVHDIVTVQAFLWNEDPKTSRGTVTTVIRTTHA